MIASVGMQASFDVSDCTYINGGGAFNLLPTMETAQTFICYVVRLGKVEA